MKRSTVSVLLCAAVVALAIPVLRADVKTTEKSTTKFGGVLGSMSRLFGRGSDDGITTTVALKGDRKLSMTDSNGEIVDLAEEKVYRLDIKKKEYKVLTFAQIRKEWDEMKADAEKNAKRMQEAQQETPEGNQPLEFTADVKETGKTKPIAGHNTREVVLTMTGVHPGKTLEEGGGMVLTTTMWLAPKIAAVDDIVAFDRRYFKAIIGDENVEALMQQMTMLFALFGNMKPAMEKMQAESRKLEGTALQSTLTMETVKAAAQAQAASANAQQSNSGGGGIGGMLGRRIAGNRAAQADNSPRSTMFTNVRELLTVATSATADDVAVPTGFKEKK